MNAVVNVTAKVLVDRHIGRHVLGKVVRLNLVLLVVFVLVGGLIKPEKHSWTSAVHSKTIFTYTRASYAFLKSAIQSLAIAGHFSGHALRHREATLTPVKARGTFMDISASYACPKRATKSPTRSPLFSSFGSHSLVRSANTEITYRAFLFQTTKQQSHASGFGVNQPHKIEVVAPLY